MHLAYQIMSNILIAYDSSGSTAGVDRYHTITKTIHEKYPSCRIISWNSSWEEISHERFHIMHRTLHGDGGTSIDNIADAILKFRFSGELIIITDGEVCPSSIDKSDNMLQNYNGLTYVQVHLIGNNANMSVSCPFTRNVNHCVYTYDGCEPVKHVAVTQEDFELLGKIDSINSISEFEHAHEALLRVLTARNMGKSTVDTEMHDKIVNLKKRLLKEFNKLKLIGTHDEVAKLQESIFNPEKWTESLNTYKTILDKFYLTSSNSFEHKVLTMLNITKGGLRNDFSHRLRRAVDLDQVPVQTIEEDESIAINTFECPLSYDLDNNVALFIKQTTPLIYKLKDNQLDDVINCPLNALNYPDFIKAITETFDVACGLSMIKMGEGALDTSPFTRADLIGQIYFGCNESQANGTNYTIATMLTGNLSKKLGNIDLWYVVIFQILQSIPRFEQIIPYAEQHLKWRLNNAYANASLSGSSQFMNIKVPLGMACWMVLASPFLHLPSKQDMVRGHVFHMDSLIMLNIMYGAYIPEKIKRHAQRLRTLYSMLSKCKKLESGTRLASYIRSLCQRCHKINLDNVHIDSNDNYCKQKVEWIPIDGDPDEKQITVIREKLKLQLPVQEIIGLYNMVNPNLSADNIELDIDWTPIGLKASTVDWPDYGSSTVTKKVPHPVCWATMRPYYRFGDQCWKDQFKKGYHENVEKCISLPKCYITFVEKYNRYPASVDELILYTFHYYCVYRTFTTLPAPMYQFACEVMDDYKQIQETTSISEFLEKAQKSYAIQDRIRMESMDVK